MNVEYRAHKKASLREIGKNEKWLQDQIANEPSILGLGDLALFRKELRQSSGGRLDIQLVDPESEEMYEVEIMLGETNPDHIIRTIEYWEIESRRYRNRKHYAVIVAENITSRFFNVIWLLNRSIPIIAIKLDTLVVDESFLLHFTTVLDIDESADNAEEDAEAEVVNRAYWEQRSSKEAMAIFDRFIALLKNASIEPKLNFRRDSIALAGKTNFAKITPKNRPECLLKFLSKLPEDARQEGIATLQAIGILVRSNRKGGFSLTITQQTIDQAMPIFVSLAQAGMKSLGI